MKSKFESSPEREQEEKKAVNEVIEALIRSQERAKSIVADNEYMLWLEGFTTMHPYFSDDSWLYNREAISKEDMAKVEELCSFFNGITSYADRNYLPTYGEDYDISVFIKFNNNGYQIGIMSGQGSFTHCSRVDITPDKYFIDFNDIVANKKQEHVDSVTQKLSSISSMIAELLENGVPASAISATVKDAFKNHKSKK